MTDIDDKRLAALCERYKHNPTSDALAAFRELQRRRAVEGQRDDAWTPTDDARKCLLRIARKLHADQKHWLHDGDDEAGVHDEECRACEYEAMLAMANDTLERSYVPPPSAPKQEQFETAQHKIDELPDWLKRPEQRAPKQERCETCDGSGWLKSLEPLSGGFVERQCAGCANCVCGTCGGTGVDFYMPCEDCTAHAKPNAEAGELSDDEIAAIGAQIPYISRLPDYLNDDNWNNVEQALYTFARRIAALQRPAPASEALKAAEYLLERIWQCELSPQQAMEEITKWRENRTNIPEQSAGEN